MSDRGAEEANQRREFLLHMAERAHDRSKEFQLHSNDAAARDAQEAIKAALAINGGAAIGVLAFVGALAGRSNVTFPELMALAYSVAWFAGGVLAAGLMAAAAYFTNSLYARATATLNISTNRRSWWKLRNHPSSFAEPEFVTGWRLG
jgi:hypothetical protein